MTSLFTSASFELEPGQVLSGTARAEGSLHICSGRAWVTIAGSSSDFWLAAGDRLSVPPGRLVVVEADEVGCAGYAGRLPARSPGRIAHLWAQLSRGSALPLLRRRGSQQEPALPQWMG